MPFRSLLATAEKFAPQQRCFSNLIYTTLSEAKTELRRRRKNKKLLCRIQEYFNGDIPAPLLRNPKALFFRQLATPNFELKRFMNITHKWRMRPLLFEYLEDKFTARNPLKHALGKMRFLKQEGSEDSNHIRTRTIIDFNRNEGKRIIDVNTVWGQPLVDFHHSLLERVYRDSGLQFFDASPWFKRGGPKASQYYLRFLALCVQHSILFENFILDDSVEFEFIESTFLPAFVEVNRLFGFRPLIVPLLPLETQSDPYWISYPEAAAAVLREVQPPHNLVIL